MTYIAASDSSDGVSKVIYQSKDGTSTKTFNALDWLAQLVTHIPHKGEQMVRYYGFYSNKSRGLRKKAGTDDQVPALIESEASPKKFRKNWARLIQKIYNVNPLLCPKCLGSMRIISLIEDEEVISKILKQNVCFIIKKESGIQGLSPSKIGPKWCNSHQFNRSSHLLPIFATIHNPFCHTAFLKSHILCPIFS